ncbi:MAG: hypothetical protein ACXABY_01225 [Candidatus Thorarchaeota archaeon]|jgi:hypothetical protein
MGLFIDMLEAKLDEAWGSRKAFQKDFEEAKRRFPKREKYTVTSEPPSKREPQTTGILVIEKDAVTLEISNRKMRTLVTTETGHAIPKVHDFRTPVKQTPEGVAIDWDKMERLVRHTVASAYKRRNAARGLHGQEMDGPYRQDYESKHGEIRHLPDMNDFLRQIRRNWGSNQNVLYGIMDHTRDLVRRFSPVLPLDIETASFVEMTPQQLWAFVVNLTLAYTTSHNRAAQGAVQMILHNAGFRWRN